MKLLDTQHCPLADPRQVGQFNELCGLLDEVSQKLPRVREAAKFVGEADGDGAVKGVLPALDRLRETLEKTHYLVGLLGVTGASKSTSLNSLIGSKVLPQGSEGRPCTSVIQRIRFIAPHQKPRLQLFFLDAPGWEQRRLMIGQELKLLQHASDKDDEELVGDLEDEIGDRDTPKERVSLLQFFLRFLRGKQYSAHRLQTTGGMIADFEDLNSLGKELELVASHRGHINEDQPGKFSLTENECALLREVYVEIPLPEAPAELELVDLPGFLAGSKQDDIITKSYLNRLDGACFLLNSQNLGLRIFDEIRNDLLQRFVSLVGRIWLVVTKVDSLADDQLNNPRNSIFHGIYKAVREWDLVEADEIYRHLLITSNEIFRITRQRSPAAVKAAVGTALKMNWDENNPLPLPPALQSDEQLAGIKKSFEHILEDGGIGRLRGVIQSELAQTVRKATAARIHLDLSGVVDQTIRVLEVCRDKRGLSTADYRAATQWSNIFRSFSKKQHLVDSLVRPKLDELKKSLGKLLNEYIPDTNLPDAVNLPNKHKRLSADLAEVSIPAWIGDKADATPGAGGIAGDAIAQLDREIKSAADEKKLPGLSKSLEEVFKPRERFVEFARQTLRKNAVHQQQWEQAGCTELFNGSWPPEITPYLYREMYDRKIDNLLFEATHRLQNALLTALEEVQQRLETLGTDQADATTDPASRETYDEIIEKLRQFKARLEGTTHA